MNEISFRMETTNTIYESIIDNIKTKVLEIANMCQISSASQEAFK